MNTPIFEYSFIVDENPQNYIRHVNNLRYLEWFIDAAIKHAETLGWGMELCKTRGLAWVAASHQIDYISPAFQADTLRIQTWISKVTPTRITRCYECRRGDQLVSKASTVWVLVDYESGKARALPKDIKEKFTQAQLKSS